MKTRVIGTAGHIDHGKTSLVRAITGVDCDRLPEEKRRGITIDLGFASWQAVGVQLSFIDVPGHERFIKNMLAGVGGIDVALLVVAADESIKPQTREHFAICRLLRIPAGLVAITKSDLVDREIVEIVRLEVEDLVAGSFLEGQPTVAVSSETGAGIDELKERLLETALAAPDRDRERRPFRLPIDRVFTVKGFGSVVTGTAVSGSLAVDAEVEVLPVGLASRARNIQVHSTDRKGAVAGERTSINLSDLPLQSIHRGQQVVEPGSFATSQLVTAVLELLPDVPPLKDQARIRFHHFSSELLGKVRILGSEPEIKPGGRAPVQLRLESPVVAVAGDRFVIRRYSPAITVGGGIILDATLGKLSRGTRPEILSTLERGSLGERLQLLARLSALRGITLRQVAQQTGVRAEVLRSDLAREGVGGLVTVGSGPSARWIHPEALSSFRQKAMTFLKSYFHQNRMAVGVPKGEFLQKLIPAALDPVVVDFLLADLVREKIITLSGDRVDVPGRSSDLAGTEGELARLLEKRFREAGLAPPPVSELIRAIPQKPKVIEGVIGYLVKMGKLVRLADGIYLHPDVVAHSRDTLEPHRGRMADIGWFKDHFGISRKVIIPLLELFDREGVTRRAGDQRQIL
jgi:selenocysteine-specific elongation factor